MNAAAISLDETVVAVSQRFQWTHGELSALFDAVKNRENWKMAIDATVRFDNDKDLIGTLEAISFFTGSTGSAVPVDRYGRYRVRAAGYYAAVGA